MAMNFATDINVASSNKVKTNAIQAPTTSGGSTYSVGSNGQVLKSNGTTLYWSNEDDPTVITDAEIDEICV